MTFRHSLKTMTFIAAFVLAFAANANANANANAKDKDKDKGGDKDRGHERQERHEHPRREEVNHRLRNEERRIEKGVENGTLTSDQAAKLRSDLDGIKAQEQAEVKANGGSLTKDQQKELNQELNKESKEIGGAHADQGRRREIKVRLRNEERRIDQGVKKGTITPEQAAKLRSDLAAVKAEEQADLKTNGGKLTQPEQKQLNQELQQENKQISAEGSN